MKATAFLRKTANPMSGIISNSLKLNCHLALMIAVFLCFSQMAFAKGKPGGGKGGGAIPPAAVMDLAVHLLVLLSSRNGARQWRNEHNL